MFCSSICLHPWQTSSIPAWIEPLQRPQHRQLLFWIPSIGEFELQTVYAYKREEFADLVTCHRYFAACLVWAVHGRLFVEGWRAPPKRNRYVEFIAANQVAKFSRSPVSPLSPGQLLESVVNHTFAAEMNWQTACRREMDGWSMLKQFDEQEQDEQIAR